MHPVLFVWGHTAIMTYTVIYAFAIALGIGLAVWKAKKVGIKPGEMFAATLFVTAIAKLGAQIWSVILMLIKNPTYNLHHPYRLWLVFKTGGAFHGALIFAGIFTLFYYKANFKEKAYLAYDVSFWAVSIIQAIGRLGCFSAGCCFGRPTDMPWGMKFPHLGLRPHPMAGIKIHPTQLYESILNFINFFFLTKLWKRKKFDGEITAYYLINYGLIRYFVEFYRGDKGRGGYLFKTSSPYLSMSLPQFISLIMIGLGIFLIIWRKRKLREKK